MIRVLVLVPLLAACNAGLGGVPSAADFVDEPVAVTPGLASCATAIGRPDLAVDPDAPMSQAEIEALLTCTAARAQG
ncbi:hypothetical protein [Jannaschia formosa]|uniref:hypothetical protein n=1 Tax=Jannaschia formosa TaxID=2259592 RepID=UPI000E1B8321|nr:hypothetical protein [Jannaschia formosa]TFL19422.1 hypothetical protein DR046_05745 [Jannaschia formosa]